MSTPILITTFRRPDFLRRLLEQIPGDSSDVYIWINGAFDESDTNKIKETIEVIGGFPEINIKQIKTNKEHFPSGYSIANAVSWIFETETRAIILEDDIIPTQEFFTYTEMALIELEFDEKIGSILGSNFVPSRNIADESFLYRGSDFVSSWGWATWSSKWEKFEPELEDWDSYKKVLPTSINTFFGKRKWKMIFHALENGKSDAWDYKWQFACWKHGYMHLAPNFNLVQNIGFTPEATHTTIAPYWVSEGTGVVPKNLNFIPTPLKIDIRADRWISKHVHPIGRFYWLKYHIKKLLQIS